MGRPLFHYFPSYAIYEEEHWKTYKDVNEKFSNAIGEIYRPGDTIWIHDYHLFLLPASIKKKFPDSKVGFFLHIPFPHFEVYRLLPMNWRKELLEGILGSDLVGFHTHDYTQYFLRCVLRILGFDNSLGLLHYNDRLVKVETFPMGIHYSKFRNYSLTEECAIKRNEFKLGFSGKKIVLSVDRLDYSKGVHKRLEAFQWFLNKYPEWSEKVILLMIVVPSRENVEKYSEMRDQIEGMIGRINGLFGTLDWNPIVYLYKSFSFEDLVALYGASDVGLVTPLRDGMNLVAKEYLASQVDNEGVLILSEMAGAAKELGEAILINPNNPDDVANAIHQAFLLSSAKKQECLKHMIKRIARYDVTKWAADFLERLEETHKKEKDLSAKVLEGTIRAQILNDYQNSKKRILFLDYDGTLVPFNNEPKSALPDPEVLNLLNTISSEENNKIYIVSGRSKDWLDSVFGDLNLGYIAEHGVWFREGKNWELFREISGSWKSELFPILEQYADRLPGSFVEEKEYSLVWHYRASDSDAGNLRARELLNDLVNYTSNIDVQVLPGNKVVEVKCAGVNKGLAVKKVTSESDWDFIVAIGDDWTDEDMFRELPDGSNTIKVGLGTTAANYYLRRQPDVSRFLKDLSDLRKKV
ncbi:bifunctional alpha,alpha-trehalose-phosphate synthase (UDP-forming)/trehalose-phosphatase [Leptospira sp. FAT2]|uniref:bifunctional alpha,alpha-trehalose-phosphate synthase (UDP-forming)/trehalose-phosphatase n=1 Tax=Leptospira sanjuanensis TaxID=2879643 RepID=UPI001EE821F1|nr:bifunctional alpha,alpha-trehalose-phosphate synthase (UDP-forming)/trehalose-phosphatase [Leptospira sanjuanensis]MCG6194527.1 bifunctional alpha,alpha-trehalose-phosphate synthase (UDP-forming)/trehalose-phosphatase [Leptospira sanjuanensis]